MEEKEIIGEVHDYVKKSSVVFGDMDVFNKHVLNVVKHAKNLSDYYKADSFVVQLAAYLHDIHYILTKDHSVHEIEGSKFARSFLEQFNIPKDKIDLVCDCILNHRGSKNSVRNTMEEKIIACADAMDHISRVYEFYDLRCKKTSIEKAKKWVAGKLYRGWNKLEMPKARELMKEKYFSAMQFFDEEEIYSKNLS
ncbi:HD domain-containing protein [Candidatus Woesearchaeota archaeon]|nr:HD domain-containing protein [Candidatus Woesearchaeota archaeon]